MKNGMNHIWRQLAAAIMGLLGFASCGKSLVDDRDDSAMYGPPPYADYKVMGTVSDEDGKPIKGIRVSVRLKYSPWSKDVEETLYSDDKGAFQLTRTVDDLPPVTILRAVAFRGHLRGHEFAAILLSVHILKRDGDWGQTVQ